MQWPAEIGDKAIDKGAYLILSKVLQTLLIAIRL